MNRERRFAGEQYLFFGEREDIIGGNVRRPYVQRKQMALCLAAPASSHTQKITVNFMSTVRKQ